MELGDIWVKVARKQTLTPQEEQFLHDSGKSTQQRNTFVAGNTSADNKLLVTQTFNVIYSEVLQSDTSTFTIPIPNSFKHIMVIGQGRINGTGGQNTVALFGRFNGDSGNNYNTSYLLQLGGSAFAAETIGTSRVVLGDLAADGAAAGHNGTFVNYIPHYLSPYYKQSLMYGGTSTASATFLANRQGIWLNTSKIQSITILPDTAYASAEIEAGSIVSIYGIL